jgi:hypothetical protein
MIVAVKPATRSQSGAANLRCPANTEKMARFRDRSEFICRFSGRDFDRDAIEEQVADRIA